MSADSFSECNEGRRETKFVYDLVNAEWDEREILFWCKNLYVILWFVSYLWSIIHSAFQFVCSQSRALQKI